MTKSGIHRVYLTRDLMYVDLQNVVAEAEVHYFYGAGQTGGTLRATGLQFTSLTDIKRLQDVMESLRKMNTWRRSALSIFENLATQAFLNSPVMTFGSLFCRFPDFGQADALSRLICNYQEPEKDIVIATNSIEDYVRSLFSDAIQCITVTSADRSWLSVYSGDI
nr:unnamed protein product [Spirometra erinaceieuropaei]